MPLNAQSALSASAVLLLSFVSLYYVPQPSAQAALVSPSFSLFLRCFVMTQKKKNAHILLCPKGHKICSSAANRKPLKDSVICRSGRGVTLLGSQRANEKGALEGSVARRGSEVACVKGGWGGGAEGEQGMGIWQRGLMFRHCAWEQEWI